MAIISDTPVLSSRNRKGGKDKTEVFFFMLIGKFPGDISGADLPTLTNPAGAGDIASGKQAIGQDGIVVTGTLPEKTADSAAVVLSTESAQLVAKTQISLANNFIKLSCPNRSGDMVLRSGAPVQILALPAAFGDATAADVTAGKTFTSAAGLKVRGKASQTINFDITNMTLEVTNLTSGSLTIYANGGASGGQNIEPFETLSLTGINLLQGLNIAGGGTSYNSTLQASGTLQMTVM